MTHSFTYCVSKPIITYSSFFLNLALGVSLFYLKKSHTSSHKQIVATLKKNAELSILKQSTWYPL